MLDHVNYTLRLCDWSCWPLLPSWKWWTSFFLAPERHKGSDCVWIMWASTAKSGDHVLGGGMSWGKEYDDRQLHSNCNSFITDESHLGNKISPTLQGPLSLICWQRCDLATRWKRYASFLLGNKSNSDVKISFEAHTRAWGIVILWPKGTRTKIEKQSKTQSGPSEKIKMLCSFL